MFVLVVGLVACGGGSDLVEDAAVVLEDASEMLRDAADTTADAQVPDSMPIDLDCAENYSLVATTDAGGAGEIARTSSGSYESVVVENPAHWLVERCGTVVTVDGVASDFGGCNRDNVTCVGTPPPSSSCALSLPSFSGTSINVLCDTTVRVQGAAFDTVTTTTYTSIRLVPR
jgi:hypothetical protein